MCNPGRVLLQVYFVCSERSIMSNLSAVYRDCRQRYIELVQPLGAKAAQTPVPACPSWSVHDVLAHVVGSAVDLVAGRLDGAPGEAWTAVQVELRRSHSIAALLAEWEACSSTIEELIDEGGHRGPLHFSVEDAAISDAVGHEHGIRGALRQPGGRDSDAVAFAVAFYARNRIERAAERGISLRVCVTDSREFGNADATVTLTGDPFDLLRAMAGRRSKSQLRGMAWTGNAESVIVEFGRARGLGPPR